MAFIVLIESDLQYSDRLLSVQLKKQNQYEIFIFIYVIYLHM